MPTRQYTIVKMLMIMGLFSVFCTFAEADIVIDGKFDSSEGYKTIYDIGFNFDST